jgi:DNA-binding XRE family transcriptional regulator
MQPRWEARRLPPNSQPSPAHRCPMYARPATGGCARTQPEFRVLCHDLEGAEAVHVGLPTPARSCQLGSSQFRHTAIALGALQASKETVCSAERGRQTPTLPIASNSSRIVRRAPATCVPCEARFWPSTAHGVCTRTRNGARPRTTEHSPRSFPNPAAVAAPLRTHTARTKATRCGRERGRWTCPIMI